MPIIYHTISMAWVKQDTPGFSDFSAPISQNARDWILCFRDSSDIWPLLMQLAISYEYMHHVNAINNMAANTALGICIKSYGVVSLSDHIKSDYKIHQVQ